MTAETKFKRGDFVLVVSGEYSDKSNDALIVAKQDGDFGEWWDRYCVAVSESRRTWSGFIAWMCNKHHVFEEIDFRELDGSARGPS